MDSIIQKLINEYFLPQLNAGYTFHTVVNMNEGKGLKIKIEAIPPERKK